MTEIPVQKSSRRLSAAIFFTIFFAYLATTSRERPWADANPLWTVAENIVAHGALDIGGMRWPPEMPAGRGGKNYATNPLLTSLVHVPGAALVRVVASYWPAAHTQAVALACHLAPSALGALTCLLFFWLACERGVSARLASVGTLSLAFASILWVYARMPYTEIIQAACFTGFFRALLRAQDDPNPSRSRALGIWAGLLLNTKVIFVLPLAGAALLLAWTWRTSWRRLIPATLWSGAMLVPAFGLIFFYNWARWGSVASSGYNGTGPVFARGSVWQGLWGMFLSPGKSIFLYTPLLVLAAFGFPHCVARYRRVVIAMIFTIVPTLLVYSLFPFWAGDFAWGARYIVFAVPVFLLPGLLYVHDNLPVLRARLAVVGVALFLCGVFSQVMGNAFYWDHFIRIAMDARVAWLGKPNRGGAIVQDRGGHCDACFEDMHGMLWLPQFQPIVGHFWALRHVIAGDDWVAAEKDGPWHPTTTLKLDISSNYPRFRIDWWILDYERDRKVAALMMTLWLGLCAAAGSFWWRAVRLRRTQLP